MFAISFLLAKETIEEVHTKVKDKTAFIKLLTADAEMLFEKCDDKEAKKIFAAFAEKVRLSDIRSSEVLFEPEKGIQSAVTKSNYCLDSCDIKGAVAWCKKANLFASVAGRIRRILVMI